MTILQFHPGPRLLRTDWDGDLRKHVEHDVTDRAAEFLFEPTELKGATLADFFALVRLNPVLLTVYRRDFIESYMEEVLKGFQPYEHENPEDRIEYLELYHHWELDTHSNIYEASSRPSLHGIGIERTVDSEYSPAGTRTQWGLLGSSVRSLLPLEVRYNPKVTVTEGDMARKKYGHVIREEELPHVSLGQLLSGVFWELSFHGAPKQTQEFFEDLKAQVDEVRASGQPSADTASPADAADAAEAADPEEAAARLAPSRNVEELFGGIYRREAAVNFESFTGKPSKLISALRDLDDDADPAVALTEKFGEGSFVLKPEAQGLTAYQLRRRHYAVTFNDAAGDVADPPRDSDDSAT